MIFIGAWTTSLQGYMDKIISQNSKNANIFIRTCMWVSTRNTASKNSVREYILRLATWKVNYLFQQFQEAYSSLQEDV